jgi:ATP-binding cassette subfamily B protein
LARALLKDPAILILDEPTSALDPGSETAIISDFSRVLRGRTAILITHRMSLVELADMVVVIDGGRVVEAGPPSDLLSRDGFLARQFGISQPAVSQ